jgi:hypothetical protein
METGPILSIIGSLGAIVISAIVGIIVANRTKPVELMTANAELSKQNEEFGKSLATVRKEISDLRDEFAGKLRVIGAGFDALWQVSERRRIHWGEDIAPMPDELEHAAIEAARSMRNPQA